MTRGSTRTPLVLVALVALAVAACGGAAPGAPTSPGVAATPKPATIGRACDLLTDAEIQSITGTSVVSKTNDVEDTVYANHCRWTLQRPDGGNGTLDLGILSPGGQEMFDHSGGSSGLQKIDGLPADAAGLDKNTGSVFAVRNDTLVDVFTLSLLLETDKDIELARKVLERLFGAAGPVATGSGAGQPTAGPGATIGDPCTLLSDQEILDLTGAKVTGKTATPRGGMWNAQCVWEVAGDSVIPWTVTLTIKRPGGRATWDQYMVPIQAEFTPVAGLGDGAFAKVLWPTHVLVGDTYLSVQFSDDGDATTSISTELARRVVENLPG